MRSRSLTGLISRLIKWVANAWVAGIHSRMDPNLWSEINDTARTGFEAVQAFTTLRQAAGVPRHEAEAGEGAIAVPGASTEVPAVPRAVHGRGDVVGHLLEQAEARCSRSPSCLPGRAAWGSRRSRGSSP